ncbi:MAG TPA: dienelactone hydrolase family protein [Anaerolineaceae bacterium]|nr:dienelactone hydrolase family protein [Anaerolineaceae bacterium]
MDTPYLSSDPHAGQPVYRLGQPLASARLALVLLHGRGSGAADILALGQALDLPDAALIAPEAAHGTWYPRPFTAPVEENEPWLSSALNGISRLLSELAEAGFGPERVGLLGFSQGACLALEYAARYPQRFVGVFGLSGALIGNPANPMPEEPLLAGTPVLLSSAERDPYIPAGRVQQSAEVFRRLGADVTELIFPGASHSVPEAALEYVRERLG